MPLLPESQRPARRGDGIQATALPVRALPAPQAGGIVPRTVAAAPLARPTYADQLTGNAILPREVSFELLRQFYKAVPVMARAINILAGFVGCPVLTSDDKTTQDDLKLWSDTVRYGDVGQGLASWTRDHLKQGLLYGYGVGEMVANTQRNELDRLWSYTSPSFGFRTDPDGIFRIVQKQGFGQEVVMDPATSLLTVPDAEGCNPNGQSLYFSSMAFCQGWLDVAHAYRAMWKRNGIPTFHVSYEPASELDDPNGDVAGGILNEMIAAWNERTRSMVMDGKPKDFFSAGAGKVSVIGADGAIIDITISKRAFVEEIVAATGIPAWMLGYSWSTTERLSTQQADMLLATVDVLRRAVGPTIRRVVATRQQLRAARGAWDLSWSDVNLQDLLQTAQADYTTQKARETRQKVERQLWADGIRTQAQYAEELTGSDVVAVEMDEPPRMAPDPAPAGGSGNNPPSEAANSLLKQLEWERDLPSLTEHLDEYAERFPVGCNGKH